MANKTYNDVQINVKFTKATDRAELDPSATNGEHLAISLGKIAKWYDSLIPTGGSSGKILVYNSSGTAKWNDPLHPTITKSADTTSTASPAHGGTFTTVDSVTRDANGHVTKINTKTVTLPSDQNTDTKVNVTLATTTKAYLLGTSTTPTGTAQAVTSLADTGVYLDTTAGRLTTGSLWSNGDITLYTSGTGNSPAIFFRRGTLIDSSLDWKLYDTEGRLHFDRNISGSTESWENILKLDPTNSKMYFKNTEVSLAGHTHNYVPNTQAGMNAAINLLGTGSSDPQLADYYIAQYAGGGTTTTTYHRRPISALWNTFRALITIEVTGDGNAVTSASWSNDGNNRKLTLTKGSTFSLSNHTHTTLNVGNKGSATNPVYFSSGAPTACTYSLGSTVNAGTAKKLAYFSGANAVSATGFAAYDEIDSTASTPVTRRILHIYGPGVGNDAASLISGTGGLLSYGDGGPQINFNTASSLTIGGGQDGALIFTDHDTAASGVSWHFVSNQGDWNVISKRFHARTSISIGTDLPNTSYNLYVNGTTYLNGNATVNGILTATDHKTAATSHGYYLKDSSGTEYGGVYDNGSNLWIGSTMSTNRHHKGQTYISTGWTGTLPTTSGGTLTGNSSILISVPKYTATSATAGTWDHTAYFALHSGNFTTTGSGNAVTSVAFDSSTQKLTFTKGSTFLTSLPSHTHAYTVPQSITIQTGSSKQSHITLQTLMAWLITTKGYITSNAERSLVLATSWQYSDNDILQLSIDGTNYELQLAGVIIEFHGKATDYQSGRFRLRIHSSPTTSFTANSGYTKFPVSHIAEYTCNGSSYSPVWKMLIDSADISSSYLPLSGGTMTGPLTMKGEQYSGNYGLNMNNSDIIGANRIVFGDLSESYTEGLAFYRSSTTYDNFWIKNGVMYFTPNAPTDTTSNVVLHSGQINTTGSGNAITSVAYDSSTNKLVFTKGSTFLTAHPTIPTSTDSTDTSTTSHGGTFTAITSVTRDSNGHVTKVNTRTYTLPSSGNTDTKVNVTLGTTTKAYVLGTSTTPTSSAQAVTSIADTGVYLDTTAGMLTAKSFNGALYRYNPASTETYANAYQAYTMAYYQTSSAFAGTNGRLGDSGDGSNWWGHYITMTHSSNYRYILRLPFWGPPQFQHTNNGEDKRWFNFITDEHVAGYSDWALTSKPMNPVMMPLTPANKANKLAFMPADKITIQYSTNGGSSWTDMGTSADAKRDLFISKRGSSISIGPTTGNRTVNMQTRVIIENDGRDVVLDRFVFYLDAGYQRIAVDVYVATASAPDTFVKIFTGEELPSWLYEYTVTIPHSESATYRFSSSNMKKFAFVFRHTYVDPDQASVSDHNYTGIFGILGFSGTFWGNDCKSYFANYDHLYNWDRDQNVTFPANVTATKFTGPLNVSRVTKDSKTFPGANKAIIEEYVGGANYNLPSSQYFHIISIQGPDTKYGTQLALGMTTLGAYYRNYNNQTWSDWKSIINTNTTYTLGTSGNNVTLTPAGESAQSITVPYATNAGNVYGTVTNGGTSTTRYGVVFAADPNTSENNVMRKTYDFRINLTNGATNTTGLAELVLGNEKAKNTADNKQGSLTLYSAGTSYHQIYVAETSSAIAHTFPATAGTILNTGTTSWAQTVASSATGAYQIGKIKINGTETVVYGVNTDTDTKVTSSANHYSPSTASGQDKTASASGATAAWSIDVVKGVTINTDGKGHITGLSVTSGKIPANPTDHKVSMTLGTTTKAYLLGSSTTPTSSAQNVTTIADTGVYLGATAGTLYSGNFYTTSSGKGHYLKDSGGNEYPGIYDNGSNLWIGSTQTQATHHIGGTYISAGYNSTNSAGNPTIYISVPTAENNNGSNYPVFHSGNFTTTGSGNAITSVAYDTNTTKLTFTKGSTFSLSNHTHTTLNVGTVGSVANPVYFSNGAPTACDYPKSGAWAPASGGVPTVTSSGVLEIGPYIDFHGTTSTADYDYRLSATTNGLTATSTGTYNVLTLSSPDYCELRFTTSASGKSTTAVGIVAYPLTTSGMTMLLNCGGNMVVGGGESASSLYTNNYDSLKTVENESLYLASDSGLIHFITGVSSTSQTSARMKNGYFLDGDINWGGKDWVASAGPIDAGLNPVLGANRFELAKAAGITIERSENTGSSWTTISTTTIPNLNRQQFFSVLGNYIKITETDTRGMGTNAAKYLLRITLDASSASIYSVIDKLMINISTSGFQINNGGTYEGGMYVKIYGRTASNVSSSTDTWVVWNKTSRSWVATNHESATEANIRTIINGWSGWNVINWEFGAGAITVGSSGSQIRQLRFVFGCDKNGYNADSSHSAATYGGGGVYCIAGYGGFGWTVPSNLAKYGHIYTWDGDQKAYFPNDVYGNAGSNQYTYTPSFGNLVGTISSGSPATDIETYFDSAAVPTGRVSTAYNSSGSEYGFIFAKGGSNSYGTVLRWTYGSTYIEMVRKQSTWKTTTWEKISAGYADKAGSIATENGSSSGARNVFYAYLGDNTKVVYDNTGSFTYNPDGGVLQIKQLNVKSGTYATSIQQGSTSANRTLVLPNASGALTIANILYNTPTNSSTASIPVIASLSDYDYFTIIIGQVGSNAQKTTSAVVPAVAGSHYFMISTPEAVGSGGGMIYPAGVVINQNESNITFSLGVNRGITIPSSGNTVSTTTAISAYIKMIIGHKS